MSRSLRFFLVLSLALVLPLSGCGKDKGDSAPMNDETASATSGVAAEEKISYSKPEIDETPLNVDDLSAPEGVVNEFFKTFFSGDDDGAFALLTSRAQNAKRDQFLAQESETVHWRITKKMKPFNGRVIVYVEVEDYTDSGSIQMDELTFVLTNDDAEWRIAGFNVGDLSVNYEGSSNEVYAENESETRRAQAAPVKTARLPETNSIVR